MVGMGGGISKERGMNCQEWEALVRNASLQGAWLGDCWLGRDRVEDGRVEQGVIHLLRLQGGWRYLNRLYKFLWCSSLDKSLIQSRSYISSLLGTHSPLFALTLIIFNGLEIFNGLIPVHLWLGFLRF
jgi:hypothetical protein